MSYQTDDKIRRGHGRFSIDILNEQGHCVLTVSREAESDALAAAMAVSSMLNLLSGFPDVRPRETEKENSIRVKDWAIANAVLIRTLAQRLIP